MNKTRASVLVPILLFAASLSAFAEGSPSPVEIAALASGPLQWRPDWPADLPPDSFSLRGARAAKRIAVRMEDVEKKEEASPQGYAAVWSPSGAVLERPFFSAGAAYALVLAYDEGGKLIRCTLSSDGTAASSASESFFFSYDPDGALLRAERSGDGKEERSAITVLPFALDELVYDAEGKVLGRYSYSFARSLLVSARTFDEDGKEAPLFRVDYDSHDRVSRLEAGGAWAEAVYDESARPLLVRSVEGPKAKDGASGGKKNDDKKLPSGKASVPGKAADVEPKAVVKKAAVESKDAVQKAGAMLERRFQWDERGLLTRETVKDAEGKLSESAYSYEFDSSGEWIERKSIVFTERFGIWASEKGPRVLRNIAYR